MHQIKYNWEQGIITAEVSLLGLGDMDEIWIPGPFLLLTFTKCVEMLYTLPLVDFGLLNLEEMQANR